PPPPAAPPAANRPCWCDRPGGKPPPRPRNATVGSTPPPGDVTTPRSSAPARPPPDPPRSGPPPLSARCPRCVPPVELPGRLRRARRVGCVSLTTPRMRPVPASTSRRCRPGESNRSPERGTGHESERRQTPYRHPTDSLLAVTSGAIPQCPQRAQDPRCCLRWGYE